MAEPRSTSKSRQEKHSPNKNKEKKKKPKEVVGHQAALEAGLAPCLFYCYSGSMQALKGNTVTWKPNVTVAAIVEQAGRFLFVEEASGDDIVINQPAGHVEPGETLLDAVRRETLEETGHHFVPEALVGIYYWQAPRKGVTYLRFAFAGSVTGHDPHRPLDEGILRTLWLSPDTLAAEVSRHRSPIVSHCMDDYLAGRRYPLELVTTLFPAKQP